MSFTHRACQVKDLEPCFSILQGRRLYDAQVKKDLLDFWKSQIEKETVLTAVVEDRRLPSGKRLVGFGFTYFITDSFLKQVKKEFPPIVTFELLKKWREGVPFLLSKKEIEKANANEGLSALVIHSGWDDGRLPPQEVLTVHSLLQECFLFYHRGYQVREFLMEAFGAQIRDFVLAGGNFLRRDYAEFEGTLVFQKIPKEIHPYLLGCTPAEAFKQHGSHIEAIWGRNLPPRFNFKEGERKILDRALLGETDEDIAGFLHLSPWTVKKRWQTIYDKVMKMDPELLTVDILPGSPKPKTPDSSNRSKQKRRYLLDYLRSHPEEMRMAQAAGKKS